MKISTTGKEVRAIRKAMGLSVDQFATMLAVHPASVKRWEGRDSVNVDGVAANVLAALRGRLDGAEDPEQMLKPQGNAVAQALLVGGALLGLAVLLKWLTEDSG